MDSTLEQKALLIESAKRNFAAEIDALAAAYAQNPSNFFGVDPEAERSAAEINVSRLHEPEAWKRIDEIEHAEMLAANADDM